MATTNVVLYASSTGTQRADTANRASAIVVRDTDGSVNVGQANVSAVVNSGVHTTSIGASTAAAGTTTSDATELPAGTANVYPTTGADGTKGVRIHASDKVTGRELKIGNGVSNQILKIYPPSGGTINGAAADAAFSSASGKGVIIVCLSDSSNTWLAW